MVNTISQWLGAGTERVLMTVGGAVGAAFSFAFGDVTPPPDVVVGHLCDG